MLNSSPSTDDTSCTLTTGTSTPTAVSAGISSACSSTSTAGGTGGVQTPTSSSSFTGIVTGACFRVANTGALGAAGTAMERRRCCCFMEAAVGRSTLMEVRLWIFPLALCNCSAANAFSFCCMICRATSDSRPLAAGSTQRKAAAAVDLAATAKGLVVMAEGLNTDIVSLRLIV